MIQTKKFKSKIHQNKDWNRPEGGANITATGFKSKIHQNKDWNYADKKVLPKRRPGLRAKSTKTRIETFAKF